MKKLLLLTIMFFGFLSFAQEFKAEEKSITCVFDATDKTKAEIFSSINKWISLNYKSPKTVLQLNDAETGSIIIKGSNRQGVKCPYKSLLPKSYQESTAFDYDITNFKHLIEIDIKDNKYRIRYTIMECIEDSSFATNSTEIYKSINFIDDNNDSVDYDVLTDSYLEAYLINKKNKESFKSILKPMLKELNTALEESIKETMLSIDKSVKSSKNDKW